MMRNKSVLITAIVLLLASSVCNAAIQLSNLTDVVELSAMLPVGNSTYFNAHYCGLTTYSDPNSGDDYYYLTSVVTSGIISDIYDTNLQQYKDSTNKVLPQELPFYIANKTYYTSICTAPISKNIIQCYYNVCTIFINKKNTWTTPIQIGCNKYPYSCQGVSISCLNDDTFFMVYGANYPEFRYSLLSTTGEYIAQDLHLYNWSYHGGFQDQQAIKYNYGYGIDVKVSNLNAAGDPTDVVNSFIATFGIQYGDDPVLLGFAGYYTKSQKPMITSVNATFLAESAGCNPDMSEYQTIVMPINDDCCYIVPYVASDDFGGGAYGVIVDNKAKSVGEFVLYQSDGDYDSNIVLVDLSMLNNNDDMYYEAEV